MPPSAGIEYVGIPGWEPGDLRSVAQYSRILNVSGDCGALAMSFATALATAVEGLA